jgi:hypothetical protein
VLWRIKKMQRGLVPGVPPTQQCLLQLQLEGHSRSSMPRGVIVHRGGVAARAARSRQSLSEKEMYI